MITKRQRTPHSGKKGSTICPQFYSMMKQNQNQQVIMSKQNNEQTTIDSKRLHRFGFMITIYKTLLIVNQQSNINPRKRSLQCRQLKKLSIAIIPNKIPTSNDEQLTVLRSDASCKKEGSFQEKNLSKLHNQTLMEIRYTHTDKYIKSNNPLFDQTPDTKIN